MDKLKNIFPLVIGLKRKNMAASTRISCFHPTRVSQQHFHSTATLPGRPDGVGSITVQEKEKFAEIKERLKTLLQHQITNFRYAFPFGRPEGALKASIPYIVG